MTKTCERVYLLVATLILVFALMSLGMRAAHAASADVSWVPPTENTDNTPVLPLVKYDTEYGICNTAKGGFKTGTEILVATVPHPQTAVTITGLTDGIWCFHVRVLGDDGQGGVWSAWSAMANKVVTGAPVLAPKPPAGITITIADLTVYTIVKRPDAFVLLPVGTAPAGTVCLPDQEVNGYYVVPKAAVTITGSIDPQVVVAKCS